MDKMEKLFKEYEKAFASLDFRKIAELYTDAFMSAGPKGIIAENKKVYLEKSEQAAEYYKSMGMTSARILSMYQLSISDQYSLVTVHWGVTFEKTGSEKIEFDVTYILQRIGDDPKIVMFISHEDEEEAMKKLGTMQKITDN